MMLYYCVGGDNAQSLFFASNLKTKEKILKGQEPSKYGMFN